MLATPPSSEEREGGRVQQGAPPSQGPDKTGSPPTRCRVCQHVMKMLLYFSLSFHLTLLTHERVHLVLVTASP